MTFPRQLRSQLTHALTLTSLALGLVAGFAAFTAQAEGSRTLYPSTYGDSVTDEGRGNLDLGDINTVYLGVVPRRTFVYVYAQAGEHILTGSRNRTAANFGRIRIYDPQSFGEKGAETIPGSANFTCLSGTTGLISTRAEELAGPESVDGSGNAAGYTPCVYVAPSTGIYGVLFSPNTNDGSFNNTTNPDQSVATPATSTNSVSAWDVTVRSSATASTTNIDGRVFTYAWTTFTSGNGAGARLYSDLYYVTLDGYRYRQRMTGIDPNGGTFFANTRGFVDSGQPLYKDIRGTNQPVSAGIPAGVSADRPEFPIFFADVSPAGANNTEVQRVLGALSIPLTPNPPQVNSFQFTYPPANSSTAYLGQGGTFSFTVTDTISFEIVISRDGVNFDPALATNRVITGSSGTGAYSVVWNGKDNAGNNFPVGNDYQFRISGRNGEAHFPFVDVEGNLRGGPILTKLNGNIQDSLVYHDDRGYVTVGGTAVGTLNGSLCGNPARDEPVPVVSLAGVDSSDANLSGSGNYYRAWDQVANPNSDCASNTQGFGDTKALNLWTFQLTQPQSSTLDIIDAADVTATLSGPAVTGAGSNVLLNVGFGNVGSQNAASVTYSIQLPSGLSGVNCSGATCNYNSGTGLVSITGLPNSLSPGQFSNFTLGYTAPASGSVNAQAAITTTTSQGPNLAPDSAATITLIGGSSDADLITTVVAPASSIAGGTVQVAIGYRNLGAATAASNSYSLTLPTGLTGVSCDSGITCSYTSGTGAVSISGLPVSLAAGASAPAFNLIYTAPASGSVQVTSTVSTLSSETTTSNNTASDITSVLGASIALDVAASVSAPATAQPGASISSLVSFQNVGTNNYTGASYSVTLPAGLSGVSCVSPVLCSYDSGSGVVTITSGVPADLAAGQSADLTVRYNAPSSGVVQITATATLAGDGNPSNNSASASTTVLTAASGADVSATVTPPATAAPAATVNVPVVYSNLGPAGAAGLVYTLELPQSLTGVSCSGAGVTCSYASGTGVVTVSGAPTSLASGSSVAFTLSYTAPGPGTVMVEAGISTSTSESNLANNNDDGSTAIAASTLADVTTTVSPPPTAMAGSTVNVPVTFSNVGAVTAAGVTYDLDLSGGATAISISFNSVACTYDSGSGAVSGCGLPASLTPGQQLNLSLSYTAPGSGTVAVTSTVATSTGESNSANNSATASTVIQDPQPDAVNDTPANIAEDSATVSISVLSNDSFGGNGPNVGAISVTPISASVGTVTVNTNGTPNDPTDDRLDFTPAPNYNGPVSITYTITDSDGDTDSAQVTFNVTPVDDTPNAVDDTPANIPRNSALVSLTVLPNDSFGGDGPSTGSISVTPISSTVGTVAVNTNGTPNDPTDDRVDFTPTTGYVGPVVITYTITDSDGDSDPGTISFNVLPPNVPNAVDDVATTPRDTPVTIAVVPNDTFGGDGPNSSPITVTVPPTNGTVVVDTNGTPNNPTDDTVRYTPTPNYTGPDTLTYQICDANGDCDTGIVSITVSLPCGGNGTVSGVVFLDANRDGVRQTNGVDAIAGNADDESGRPSLVSLVPASGATRILAADANGNYSFNDVPEGAYTVVMLDSYLANVLNLYATGTVSRAVTVAACATVSESFGYATPTAGVVGDFVWFDSNQSGNVDEYFDADGNGQLTNNTGSSTLDESNFEWVDLNANNTPDAGEFARCGIEAVSVELLDGNGNVVATTSTNARGAYRFLNLPFGSSYRTRVVNSDADLTSGAQVYQANGRCRAQPVTKVEATTAKGVVGCGMTTASTRTSPVLTAQAPVFDALDFGHVCAAGTLIGADLQLTKTVSNPRPSPGETVTFTITVRNNGPANATGVQVVDMLPSGYGFVGTGVSQGSWSAPTWTVGSVANGASATMTMQATVRPSGNWTNVATVTADQTDPTPGNEVDTDGITPNSGAAVVPVDQPWALLGLLLLMLGLGGWQLRLQHARSR